MIEKYFNKPLIFDFTLSFLIVVGIHFFRSNIELYFNIPCIDTFNKLGESIIRVSSSIIGFLLTVTTVIVTFKRGFLEKQKKDDEQIDKEKKDFSEIPTTTIFDKKHSKEKQFYGTNLHKKVASVFIGATFEIGFVLFMLLSLQINEGINNFV